MKTVPTVLANSFIAVVLSGCAAPLIGPAMLAGSAATGMMSSPSNVTGNYTNEEFETCLASLTQFDIQRARDAAEGVGFIPGVGPLLVEERMYEEIEAICHEKGTLPRREERVEEASE